MNLNIFRICAVSPQLHPAFPAFNVEKMASAYAEAAGCGASLVLFPAYAVTGRSCGVLLSQPYLLESAWQAVEKFAAATGTVPAVFGAVKVINGTPAECAVVAQNGKIAGVVANVESTDVSAISPEEEKLFAAGQIFDGNLRFSVNFAGNMPGACPADIQLFCGAEAEMPGSWQKRKNFYSALAEHNSCAVAAAFAGKDESTGDQLYGGGLLIADQGKIVSERPSPAFEAGMIYAEIDLDRIHAAQFKKHLTPGKAVKLDAVAQSPDLRFLSNPSHPFLPENEAELSVFCRETFALQTIGLGERMLRCRAQKMVLGISGGLDSTLALVVLAFVCKKYGFASDTILAVTMPGFGTTGRTKNNALKLAEILGAEIREVPIAAACLQHFADIGHDANETNSVYENSQARERTQILMDIANKVNGIVIGTGDLSEIALGWSTFNGDQMAMYAVNSSIPKSNIAAMLQYAAKELPGTAEILQDVIDTPVSPELLPLDENGQIAQKTEAILGAYELHDYYLWQLYHGVSDPAKLLILAQDAFKEKYPESELLRVRDLFLRRFFTQQFKRTAAPDGIQAGVVSLSARGSWQMPADIADNLWLK